MASQAMGSSSPPLKRAKLNKGALYKPPTNEELHSLKETNNLYQSNLFRMQMEELIGEVQVTEKRKKVITKTLQELNTVLTNLPPLDVPEVANLSWLPSGVESSATFERSQVKGQMSFQKPASVKVVGSFLLDILARPDLSIDLAVEMPQSCRQPKDYLNFRYHHKRALYCVYLANQLRGQEMVDKVHYCWKDGDHTRPIVVLSLSGKTVKHVHVKLHPCLPESNFKAVRFIPSKSNIRQQWYTGNTDIEEMFPATPHYNSSILADMAMERHLHCLYNTAKDFPGFKDGVLLLKVWLHQRELDKAFSGFIMSMFVAYLLSKRVLNKLMSGYQVFRNTVLHLAGSDWTTNGISLCTDASDKDIPTIKIFHQYFDIVFVDTSGYLNICANMTKATFQQVHHEATLAKTFLDAKSIDSFDCLFMKPLPFVRKFDHILHLKDLKQLKESCRILQGLEDNIMDRGGDYIQTCLPRLLELLHQGLGSRVVMIAFRLQLERQWSITDKHPKLEDIGSLSIGLLLNPENASSVLERGPEANTPEAEEFQKFWGDRSELRRFQDGSICEAVVWPGESAAQKRLICGQIIVHLFKIHAGISPDTLTYVGGQLDSVLHLPLRSTPHTPSDAKPQDTHPSTGEEENMTVIQVYNDLSKDLRGLKDFPLVMTSIQGTSPSLRYTEVFPPTPARTRRSTKDARIHGYVQIPVPNQPCPEWVPAINVICQLEGTGKWPDNLQAIRRIKAAFHIRLANMLHKQYRLITSATPKYVDILKEGFVFRVEVTHRREIGLLKETYSPEGMKILRDNPDSLELERRTVMLPRLTSTLHGIQQQHGSFSGCARLAKRWLCAHLLSNHVPKECIDLLVAYLFLHPAPHTVPGSPLVGFLRFLHLLCSHDWTTSPIIVNLNNEMKDSDYEEIRANFSGHRSRLPCMFLATPTDKLTSVWTQKQPTVQMLQRMVVLAQESIQVLTSQMMTADTAPDFKQVFRPPIDLYDVVIHLRPKLVSRRGEVVDSSGVPGQKSTVDGRAGETNTRLPVVDFDPVTLYLQELENAYSDLALFFYDRHGGDFIAVLWNPTAFQPRTFKVVQAKGTMPQTGSAGSKEADMMIPNVEAILEDFQVLGQGLVRSVEVQTEKWVI